MQHYHFKVRVIIFYCILISYSVGSTGSASVPLLQFDSKSIDP